ncbi:TauD/TfdA family dioxygenase [Variovorax sp. Sphag1AA]|uniref:TauD/TfdA dioxygenase family protein n=1 Tax=Variovorax sp. Sphag1AA TaxID=2587027 RepID=UPI001609EA78|nr:TauD/TfdA family dioxygenase [Variovorax sp. Sphag1AA]MBB3181472.1 taurine dioxygenase [Variovorax sp. Sphag1AA]
MSLSVAERPSAVASSSSASPFRISPLDAALGALVEGFDVRRAPTGAQIHALKVALQDHHILLFRGQQPDDEDFLQFSSYFGTIFSPPRNAPVLGSDPYGAAPDIVLVSNVEDGLLGNAELTAHADHHWTPQPSSGSLLHALEIPAAGGDTTWFNLVAAYEALDEATRREIDGLQLITYNPFLRKRHPLPGVQGVPRYRTPDIEPLTPWVAHPLVRTHPDSGKRLLYLGEATEVEIVGYDPARGAALIARLREHLLEPRFAYTHRWKVGDIVYWDNQATLHSRTAFDPALRRRLKRISLAGSRPF